jgi:hypothetical protein
LLVPYLLNMLGFGASDIVMRVIKIIVFACVLIWLLWLLYDVISCMGVGGPGPSLGYRRG